MKETVLITGASSGLGEAFAHLLATQFQRVILVARNQQKLEALARQLRIQFAVETLCWVHDLTQPAERDALLHQIAAQDIKISLLINNAGEGAYGAFDALPFARYQQIIDLNITALTALNHALLPHIAAHHGRGVINIASLAALQPLPFMAMYAASKSYVLHLSAALAEEYRHTGITVMALCPGFIETPFIAKSDIKLRGLPLAKADDVARRGWQAFLQKKSLCITGTRNRLLALLMRLTPRGLATRVAGYLMKQQG